METLTDEMLLQELKRRLDEKDKALVGMKALNNTLENTNKRLQESEKLKSNFLSNLRNEINNPLTALLALSTEMVTLDSKDRGRYKDIDKAIHSEVLNLDFQIRNVLIASELESGEADVHMTKVDAKTLVQDALQGFTYMIEARGLKVHVDSPASKIYLNTDSEKLQMIISNLISNGIVFNKDGGGLYISIGISNDEFTFSVKDEGAGIEECNYEMIFDRFKQLDVGVRKSFKGHGLGLSVAKAIVEVLGGEITVESSPGKGSVFTFHIPAQTDMKVEDVTIDGAEYFLDDDMEKDMEF